MTIPKISVASNPFMKLSQAHFLVFASMFANVCNFLYNAYLGRHISIEAFGIITLIGSILNLAQIPLSSFSRTIVYKSAYLFGKHKVPASWYWRVMRGKTLYPTIILVVLWLLVTPLLTTFFQVESIWPFILFTPIWAIGVAQSVDSGFLSGSHAFGAIAFMMIVESVSKLLLTIAFVTLSLESIVYIVIPISAVISFFLGWFFVKRVRGKTVSNEKSKHIHLPGRFFLSTILTKVSSVAILTFDVILAKHYLPPKEAGEYAILSLIGKMIYFIGSLLTQFIVPIVAKHGGEGTSSSKTFKKIFWLTCLGVGSGVLAVGLFGYKTVPWLLGDKALPIVPFLLVYTIAMAAFSLGNAIVSYNQALERHEYSLVSLLSALSIVMGIVLFHNSVASINLIISLNAILFLFVVLFMQKFQARLRPLFLNIDVLLRLFTDKYKVNKTPKQLSILIFNWRDTRHVWAGGAENYVQELSKEWIKLGHKVTVFCGNDQRSPRNEVISGVQIVRRGGFYTVYFWAFIYYVLRFKNNFDIVIDCENGIPFFTPLFVGVPKFLVIHHVHQEVLRKHLVFPLSYIGMFIESKIMPLIYANTPIITISESSKNDIIKLGFKRQDLIQVIYSGIDQVKFHKQRKTKHPSILYLGRLKRYKQIEVAIEAFARIHAIQKQARFTIAGFGNDEKRLRTLVKSRKLSKKITFLGKVSEAEKIKLLGTHWVMVQPSLYEGWGLTVIEANASGTPVIASRVSGLVDSVVHAKTGLLFEPKDIKALEDHFLQVITNHDLRKRLSNNSYLWSQQFTWKVCAAEFLSFVNANIRKQHDRTSRPMSIRLTKNQYGV